MLRLILTISLLIVATAAQANPPVGKLIDYLRETPAWIDGRIRFKQGQELKKSPQVALLEERDMHFSFGEDFLNVYPAHALKVKWGLFNIEVKGISWSPKSGFKASAELPVDFFGYGKDYAEEKIAEELEKLYGAKMKAASLKLSELRKAKKLTDSAEVVKAIGSIFATGKTSTAPLPDFSGEIGLNFQPNKEEALMLGNTRIGIKAQDRIRAGVEFNVDKSGFHPVGATLSSERGIDINEGSEFKMNKRIVFNHLSLNESGTNLNMHLGASETLVGIIALAQLVTQSAGLPPSGGCSSCEELIMLDPFRIPIEIKIREELKELVEVHRAELLRTGVTETTLKNFLAQETCQLNGLICARECQLKTDKGSRDSCLRSCQDKLRLCTGK
jgi:hypothetical protein